MSDIPKSIAEFYTHIPAIEKTIGYTFRDKSLLCQAFTRGSFCNEVNFRSDPPLQSNEVLEFFGDSVLSAAIVTFFVAEKARRYEYGIRTELNEGELTNIKSHLSDKRNLSSSMRELGLQRYLLMGEGDKKIGIQNGRSVMEDLFESILGAVYIDSGYSLQAIVGILPQMLDFSSDPTEPRAVPIQSSKNALQEYCDAKGRRYTHEYVVLEESGPDHDKRFVCGCRINGRLFGTGEAGSKKDAEAIAATEALAAIRREDEARGSRTE